MRTVEVEIERVVPGGEGLARDGGKVVLVRGALPGERVRAEIDDERERLARARVTEVLSPGALRRPDEEICARARDGSCGGCDWPFVREEAERLLKVELVRDALRRVGKLDLDGLPEIGFVPSPPSYRLRNRLHVGPARGSGETRLGFFAPASHDVGDISPCQIVSGSFLRRYPALGRAFAGTAARGELTTLEGRDGDPFVVRFDGTGAGDARALVARLREGADGAHASDSGRVTSDGPSHVDVHAGGGRFRVSVTSFFQGNRHLLDAFLDAVRSALDAAAAEWGVARRAADVYAGVGFLTWPLVERGVAVDAVEADASSSADLAANARAWGGVRAMRRTAEAYLRSRPRDLDLVIADPPRAGLSEPVRSALRRAGPPAVVLVSCDPATLARDLGALAGPYAIRRFTLLNLFPATHHVEAVVLLSRTEARTA